MRWEKALSPFHTSVVFVVSAYHALTHAKHSCIPWIHKHFLVTVSGAPSYYLHIAFAVQLYRFLQLLNFSGPSYQKNSTAIVTPDD